MVVVVVFAVVVVVVVVAVAVVVVVVQLTVTISRRRGLVRRHQNAKRAIMHYEPVEKHGDMMYNCFFAWSSSFTVFLWFDSIEMTRLSLGPFLLGDWVCDPAVMACRAN